MSDTPVESVTVRRRSLRGEPTSTLSPSPEASLASMVGKGKGINEIALHLALTHDEVRERLSAAGLLELVEAPDAPAPALPTLGPAFILTRTPDAPAVTLPAPPVVSQEPKRRGRPPKIREEQPHVVSVASAQTVVAAAVVPPTATIPARLDEAADDLRELGAMCLLARMDGVPVEVRFAEARALVARADRLGY